MIESRNQTNLVQQLAAALCIAVICFRNEGWRQNVFDYRTLRQQAVVLENKPNLFVSECGQLLLLQCKRILTFQSYSPGAGRLKSAQDVEQCALAAPRGTHDRNRIST